MNRKQQIAIALMALYFIVAIASGISNLWLSEEDIIRLVLQEEIINVDPSLEDLNSENLSVLSSQLASYIRWKTVINVLNMVLLAYLFVSYLEMYRNTKASFTLGLVFLSGALLSYSLFSNPLLLSFNRGISGLQIIRYFNVIPDFFTTMASTILIYLSRQ